MNIQKVATLPNSDLLKPTHLAMKNKLSGIQLPNKDGVLEDVDISFSRPEEWYEKRLAPSININAIRMTLDPSRHTTDKLRAWKTNTKDTALEKQYMSPVKIIYEIRFIVRYGQHMMSLSEEIFNRFPPLDFGSYVEVAYGDGVIYCPFRQLEEKEIFARYGETEDNREFEKLYRYELETWVDVHNTTETKTAHTIDIQTDIIT